MGAVENGKLESVEESKVKLGKVKYKKADDVKARFVHVAQQKCFMHPPIRSHMAFIY